MYPHSILIMISYEMAIGFAIGRLISVFHEMATQLTGDDAKVHFSFGSLGTQPSSALPADFANLLEFNYRNFKPADLARFAEYLRKNDIQLIFALDMPVTSPALPQAREAGVKTVISYYGAPMSSLNSGLKLLLKRLEVRLLRRHKPDHFIFESQAMRQFGVSGRGLPLEATSIVHTGVDTRKFRPEPNTRALVRERLGIPAGRKIVVNMGHLHRRKGVHVLMQAAEILVGSMGRTDIHCLFLGNRPEDLQQFPGIIHRAADYVTFAGYQNDIPALLNGCDVGCIPSTGWDSFPMSSLEMQSCGLPVIVSDLQGTPETIVDGETGVVVPAGDAARLAQAIVGLLDDPARVMRMGHAARQRIEAAFSRESQIANLVAQVERVTLP